MMTNANITIDEEYGQIQLPLEINEKLNLRNFEWLKVNILSNKIALSLSKDEVDEQLIKSLVHEGVLIDPQ